MARGVDRRIRRFALLGVVLHTLLVGAAPFEHHDLICHLKTPQHCTSCTASPVGSSAQAHRPDAVDPLIDAGSALTAAVEYEPAILTSGPTGRSPPTFARP
jgi:hypothetical protein